MSVTPAQKRLGRGLAALLGDAAAPASVAAPGVQQLAVDLLEPSPFQPRKDMDDTALGELADSITQRGILQPLLVRPHPAEAGHYQIIAGERRWRAAQRAGLHEVPVWVRPLSDADAMAAGLVENLQRADLNPIEEAQGYLRLLEEFQLSQEKLGEAVGKSRTYITNALRVLKLPEPVLAMVRDGKLSMGHARVLVNDPAPLQSARLFIAKAFTVRQAEDHVNNLGRTFKGGVAPKTGGAVGKAALDTDVERLAEDLTDRLGLKVRISHKGKAGAITVHYSSLDQLDMLLGILNK